MQSPQSMQVQLKTPLNKEEKKKLGKYMKKGDVNKQPDLRAYLVIAITEDNIEMILLLLRSGININESLQFNNRNNVNSEPLLSLIKSGQLKSSYIELAMDRKDSQIFNLFVQLGANLRDFKISDLIEELPSHPENLEKIKRLIGKVDLNVQGYGSRTALFYAVDIALKNSKPEYTDLVKRLLVAGATPDTATDDGILLYTLFQKPYTQTHISIVRMLLEHHADPKKIKYSTGQGLYSFYPLKAAVENPSKQINIEIIKLLIQAGADINVTELKANDMEPFFQHAVEFGKNDELTKLIANSNLDLTGMSRSHGTNLHMACAYSSEEVIQILLDKGADIHAMGGFITTSHIPLFCASRNQKISDNFLLKLLPDKNNINNVNQYGYTALEIACVQGFKKLIPLLLERGADPKKITKKNYDELKDDIKEMLVPKPTITILTETATKIVSRLMRNINSNKKIESLTPEIVTQLRQTVIQSLTKPGLIDDLTDDNDPEIIQMRSDLVSSMQNDVLSCIIGEYFDKEDLICAVQEAVMLWKGKKITSEKEQKAAAEQLKTAQEAARAQNYAANKLARANAEAAQVATQLKEQTADAKRAQAAAEAALSNARAAERIYSTPAAKQTLYAPPQENKTAANMNAAANIINAVARFETGLANDVNAFNNAFNP